MDSSSTGHRAHFPGRAAFVVTQHEHRPLPLGELGERSRETHSPFPREQLFLRGDSPFAAVRSAKSCWPPGPSGIGRTSVRAAFAALIRSRAPVDQDAREPDFEGQLLTKRVQVRVSLDEGVLDGFVGLGGVAHVMQRNPHRPALVPAHQFGVSFPRFARRPSACMAFTAEAAAPSASRPEGRPLELLS